MDLKGMANTLAWGHHSREECNRDSCGDLERSIAAALEMAYQKGFDDGVEDCNPTSTTARGVEE